jgi:membrane-bound transcription factor site-1 protease
LDDNLPDGDTVADDDAAGDGVEEMAAAEATAQRVGNDSFTGTAASRQRSQRRLQRQRRRLLQAGSLASILQADSVWAEGFSGQGVRMGVFDTGIKGDHPDVKNIV